MSLQLGWTTFIAGGLVACAAWIARAETPVATHEMEAMAMTPVSERWVVTPRQRLMARVIFAEACDEPLEGKIAVASVILNRLVHPDYPHDLEEVIYQPNAFTCFASDSRLWQLGGRAHQMNSAERRQWEESMEAAKLAMLGHGDPTLIAYRHIRLTSDRGYFGKLTEVATIGRHRFYSERGTRNAERGSK